MDKLCKWVFGSGTDLISTHIFVFVKKVKGKGRYSSSWEPHLRATWRHFHMGSHSVTCHPTQVNAPRLTPAIQAGTRFTYPGGMEGWVDLVDSIASRPGVEPATFRSPWVQRRTAAPPRQLVLLVLIWVDAFQIRSGWNLARLFYE